MTELGTIAIIERAQGHSSCIWSYPSIDDATESILVARSAFAEPFLFAKHGKSWQYFLTKAPATGGLVSSVTLVALSTGFNPDKMRALLEIVADQYLDSGSPVSVLKSVLCVRTTKTLQEWKSEMYDDAQALAVSGASLGDLVSALGLQSVLIWTAMLKKKRVAVVGDSAASVIAAVQALPQFARQDLSILRPLVTMSANELDDLEASGVYVAGFLESSGVRGRSDLFDLLVDISAREVVVADHARESFRMSELHKELASFMTTSLKKETEGNQEKLSQDRDFLKGLAARTLKVIEAVRGLCEKDPSLSAATLDAAKVPKSARRFMVNVAVAEGLFLVSPLPCDS
mmetsp:Transcript_64121/g.144628  ORF Transcript_64121/g.144628 Transcript_64121/m.144628 type:complete len:345 (+) Transcript_64121:279-1313(+)|eukprot:CAMPEP_0172627396 /NCGR_PEP_ID=MMETSP1068-20121228/156000_1 /TAXON_ID=35684 /ORGANISM="Pseudopedinella elastica, Strain CCMP716" /LENGTH=344 /DNA_ID=CAMNT_0013437265 /DNA_START=227 /DNA_END=1261 /DNA_ORIENTATION=+